VPLLDHFHPPLSKRRHWQNIHSAWANAIRDQLNDGLLPPSFFAEVQISLGSQVEVDVATLEEKNGAGGAGTRAAVAVWAPPAPETATVCLTHPDLFEVQVLNEEEGPRLVAALELVSPTNKDRPGNRHQFVVKCGSYLQQGIGLVVVDVVTHRTARLHAQLFELVQAERATASTELAELFAGAYRTVFTRDAARLEYWLESLALGQVLPTMPLWLKPDLYVPVELEQAYQSACKKSRISMP
jgi:hypothetical protein